jgi:hypothetical protein
MQTLNSVNNSTDSLEVSSFESVTTKIKSTRPKLHMKWEKEFDGKRYRLVARWVS